MEVTRNVILDLMPLYLANEVSEDSRILINKYLEVDMELAQIVKKEITAGLADDVPLALTSDRQLELYREAKRLMFWRTVVIAVLVVFVLMTIILIAGAIVFLQPFYIEQILSLLEKSDLLLGLTFAL